MNPILELHCKTGRFSQGYLFIGDLERSRIAARKMSAIMLGCVEDSLSAHPDFLEQIFDIFSLDDLRGLAQKTAMKPILSQEQIFILKISSIAPEAILSFDAFFENAPPASYFFLILPPNEEIPAILRLKFIDVSEKGKFKMDKDRQDFWREFFRSGPMERLAFSKNAAGDKKEAIDFLNELEVVLDEKLRDEKNREIISYLEEVNFMRQFLFSRASYPKMIIEHFALTLPQF